MVILKPIKTTENINHSVNKAKVKLALAARHAGTLL